MRESSPRVRVRFSLSFLTVWNTRISASGGRGRFLLNGGRKIHGHATVCRRRFYPLSRAPAVVRVSYLWFGYEASLHKHAFATSPHGNGGSGVKEDGFRRQRLIHFAIREALAFGGEAFSFFFASNAIFCFDSQRQHSTWSICET